MDRRRLRRPRSASASPARNVLAVNPLAAALLAVDPPGRAAIPQAPQIDPLALAVDLAPPPANASARGVNPPRLADNPFGRPVDVDLHGANPPGPPINPLEGIVDPFVRALAQSPPLVDPAARAISPPGAFDVVLGRLYRQALHAANQVPSIDHQHAPGFDPSTHFVNLLSNVINLSTNASNGNSSRNVPFAEFNPSNNNSPALNQYALMGYPSGPLGPQSGPLHNPSYQHLGQQSRPSAYHSGPVAQQSRPLGFPSGPLGQQSGPLRNPSGPFCREHAHLGFPSGPLGQQSGLLRFPAGPVGQQSRPLGFPSGLLGQQSGPLRNPSGPVGQQYAPLGQQSGPLGQQSGPLRNPSGPVGQQYAPLGQQSGPLGQQSGPLRNPSGPVGQQYAPLGQQSGPLRNPSGPVGQQSGPINQQTNALRNYLLQNIEEVSGDMQHLIMQNVNHPNAVFNCYPANSTNYQVIATAADSTTRSPTIQGAIQQVNAPQVVEEDSNEDENEDEEYHPQGNMHPMANPQFPFDRYLDNPADINQRVVPQGQLHPQCGHPLYHHNPNHNNNIGRPCAPLQMPQGPQAPHNQVQPRAHFPLPGNINSLGNFIENYRQHVRQPENHQPPPPGDNNHPRGYPLLVPIGPQEENREAPEDHQLNPEANFDPQFDNRAYPHGQLHPRARSPPVPLDSYRPSRIRACSMELNLSLDITPEAIPRLPRNGGPFFLFKDFQIIISTDDSPPDDGMDNLAQLATEEYLQYMEYMGLTDNSRVFHIYDGTRVYVRLRFDREEIMFVLADSPARGQVSQLVHARNNEDIQQQQQQQHDQHDQHDQMNPSELVADAVASSQNVTPAIIRLEQRPAAASAELSDRPSVIRRPRKVAFKKTVAISFVEEEEDDNDDDDEQEEVAPKDLSQQKTATPLSTPAKRLAESELSPSDGSLQLKQAKVVYSLQKTYRASLRIVERSSLLDESTSKQEKAGTSSTREQSQPKLKANATNDPTSQANRRQPIKSQANAIASINKAGNTSANSLALTSSTSGPSNSTRGRYSRQTEVKPKAPSLPTLQASYNWKKKSLPNKSVMATPETEHCFKCHNPGEDLQYCSRCSLGWHHGCSNKVFNSKLSTMTMTPRAKTKPASRKAYADKQAFIKTLSSVVDPTVCIECARKEAGVYYNKHYGFLKDFEESEDRSILERSAAMFQYAVKSLAIEKKRVMNRATGKYNSVTVFRSFVRIDYGKDKAANQIDLERMLDKAQTIDAYQCTEEFFFDIKMLCHSYLILQQEQGVEAAKLQSLKKQCNQLIASAQNEMDFIERCDSCYRNHYEINHKRVKSDMVMPCENPHALVWMVLRNQWWPAKVYDYRESKFFFKSNKYIYVVPFGAPRAAKWTSYKSVRKFSKHPPAMAKPKPKSLAKYRIALERALSDAKQYYQKYWNEYFTKKYPLPVKAKPFSCNNIYVNVTLKPGKNILDQNFILSPVGNADDETEAKTEHSQVNRGQKLAKREATRSTQKASTSRVEPVAGPSNGGDRGANSGDQPSNKKATKRSSRK